jgi:Uma2 family endonuclease
MQRWRKPGWQIIGGVSFRDYLWRYAMMGYEWVDGFLFKEPDPPVDHEAIGNFVGALLYEYCRRRLPARVVRGPYPLRFSDECVRLADVAVFLEDNPGQNSPAGFVGAADIVVEVATLETRERDFIEKMGDYQSFGVREYWLLDPPNEAAFFYRERLGTFQDVRLDGAVCYTSSLLPGFMLHIDTLWEEWLPDPVETVAELLGEYD